MNVATPLYRWFEFLVPKFSYFLLVPVLHVWFMDTLTRDISVKSFFLVLVFLRFLFLLPFRTVFNWTAAMILLQTSRFLLTCSNSRYKLKLLSAFFLYTNPQIQEKCHWLSAVYNWIIWYCQLDWCLLNKVWECNDYSIWKEAFHWNRYRLQYY